jgi:hypothetical protein
MYATPAPKGAMGRRPSTPTGPAASPGAATCGYVGEGKEAAHTIRPLASGNVGVS